MQPGIYFTNRLNPVLAALDLKKAKAEKATKEFSLKAFKSVAAKQFGISPQKVIVGGHRATDMTGFRFFMGYGRELHVTTRSVGGAVARFLAQKEKADSEHSTACKSRCKVADLLDNSNLKAFTARVRAIYGSRKDYTATELAMAFTDWTRINAPHVCPR